MRLARKGAIDRVKQNELHMDVLRCRSADDAYVPVLASIIDKAFVKRGFVGSGAAIAASIEKLSNIVLIYQMAGETQEVLGACPIREYPCNLGPTTLVAGGLSLVAVDPAHQRRGIGQKMLAGAEEHMYKNGFEIGILFTGSPSFYRHAGWVQATNEPYCALQVGEPADQGASGFTFRWLDRSDRAAATRLYEYFNKDRPLTRIRDEVTWERRIDRQGEKYKYLGAFLGGTLIGYCCIEFHKGKDARLDIGEYAISTRRTTIEEGRVLDAMLGRVNALAIKSGCRRVGTSLPATYPFSARLRASGAEVKDAWWSPMMILVINVPAFVEKLGMYQERVVIPSIDPAGIARVADFCIGLAVEDPRGTDPVVVQYAKTGDRVSVRVNPPGRPGNLVPISRGQLALLAFGNFTPRMLVESGNWACPEALLDPLAAFFPTVAGTVYPRDHF